MATTRKVILIGTAHHYQESGKPGTHELRAFAEKCGREFGIRAIGEEMSREALKERNVSSSVGADLARTLGMPHRYCDPHRHKRVQIGISQENDIRASGFLQDWSDEEIDAKIQSARRRREEYWISQIIDLALWPLLFICGATHIDSLRDLLRTHGIAVQVACQDWAPEAEC